MNKVLFIKIISFFYFFMLFFNCSFAGWIINEESTDRFNNKNIQTTFIEGNKIRYETHTSIAIIDLDSSKITMVFPQYKVYWKGTVNELRQSTVLAYDREIETLLAGVPTDQRKELDSIYASLRNEILNPDNRENDHEISIVASGLTDTILGYSVDNYDVMVDGVLKESIWFSNAYSPYYDIDTKKLNEFMKHINPESKNLFSVSDEYMKMWSEGIVMKIKEIEADDMGYTTVITNIREVAIPYSFFEPPVNYRFSELREILNMIPLEDVK